jgi:hypothetical protein
MKEANPRISCILQLTVAKDFAPNRQLAGSNTRPCARRSSRTRSEGDAGPSLGNSRQVLDLRKVVWQIRPHREGNAEVVVVDAGHAAAPRSSCSPPRVVGHRALVHHKLFGCPHRQRAGRAAHPPRLAALQQNSETAGEAGGGERPRAGRPRARRSPGPCSPPSHPAPPGPCPFPGGGKQGPGGLRRADPAPRRIVGDVKGLGRAVATHGDALDAVATRVTGLDRRRRLGLLSPGQD